MEMVAPEKVCCRRHADPHSAHPSAAPDPSLVKWELELTNFYADPSQWEHDLAFPHMTVLTDLDFRGNHYEED